MKTDDHVSVTSSPFLPLYRSVPLDGVLLMRNESFYCIVCCAVVKR